MRDLMGIQLQLEDEMFNGGIRRFEADQQRQIASGNEFGHRMEPPPTF